MTNEANRAASNVTRAWRFRAQAIIVYAAAAALGCVAMATFFPIQIFVERRKGQDIEGLQGIWTFELSVAAFLLLCAAFLARYALRYRRLPRLVEEHDGMVCPTCIEPLQESAANGGMTRSGDEAVAETSAPIEAAQCTKCGVSYERQRLRWYWGDWPWPSWILKKWYLSRARPRSRIDATGLWIRRWIYGHRLRISLLTGLGVGVPLVGFLFIIMPPVHLSVTYALFRLLPLVLMAIGYVMYGLAFRYFDREEARCHTCRYEKHLGGDSPSRCPECGSFWNAIGGTKITSYRIRPALLTVGVVLLIGGFAMLTMGTTKNLPQRYAATDTLIDIVLADRSESARTVPEWMELRGSRELTEVQRNRLIEGMLERRDAGLSFGGVGGAWLSDQMRNGLLTDEQREQFFAGMAVHVIDGPHRINLGESATLAVVTDFRHGAIGVGETYVYFGGFRISSASEPHYRADETVQIRDFGRLMRELPWYVSRENPLEPQITLTAESVGELLIAADLWTVVKPSRTGTMPITWNDDGTPQLTEDLVIWKQHRTLEHRITIIGE
jgi:predicted Zn-ribbon and HTH transcriptional regulator